MIRGLYRVSPPGFIFASKMPRLINNKKRLRLQLGVEDDLERFLEMISIFLRIRPTSRSTADSTLSLII